MGDPWLVVGLGNPTDRYARNRHNVGQMVVDLLAGRAGARWTSHKSRALVAEARLGVLPGGAPGPRVVLTKSTGYMNVSGGPVAALARALGIEPARILVVHDELDLPLGSLRLKLAGGEGGGWRSRRWSCTRGSSREHERRHGCRHGWRRWSTTEESFRNDDANPPG